MACLDTKADGAILAGPRRCAPGVFCHALYLTLTAISHFLKRGSTARVPANNRDRACDGLTTKAGVWHEYLAGEQGQPFLLS